MKKVEVQSQEVQFKNQMIINNFWSLLEFYKTAIKYDIED